MYEITKALHIISLVAWFAGLFYMPRLFVYHVKASENEHSHEMLKTMERKLYFYIMMPAMVLTWLFGLSLIKQNPALLEMGWLHAKLTIVLALTVFHFNLHGHMKNFSKKTIKRSEKFYRIYNELPTFALIAAVVLAILKPF